MRPPKNRETILNAGLQLFCSKGYNDTSMKEIAQRAGVSQGNIYNYFQGKEELFDYLFSRSFPGNFVELIVRDISSAKSFEEKIETALMNIIRYADEHPYFFKLVLVDANEFGGKHLKKLSMPYSRPVEEFFSNPSDMPELRKDIHSKDFTAFFSWLFYAIGMTDIVFTNAGEKTLKDSPVYTLLLKILKSGLRNQQYGDSDREGKI